MCWIGTHSPCNYIDGQHPSSPAGGLPHVEGWGAPFEWAGVATVISAAVVETAARAARATITPPTVDPTSGIRSSTPNQDRQGQGVLDVQGQHHEVVELLQVLRCLGQRPAGPVAALRPATNPATAASTNGVITATATPGRRPRRTRDATAGSRPMAMNAASTISSSWCATVRSANPTARSSSTRSSSRSRAAAISAWNGGWAGTPNGCSSLTCAARCSHGIVVGWVLAAAVVLAWTAQQGRPGVLGRPCCWRFVSW